MGVHLPLPSMGDEEGAIERHIERDSGHAMRSLLPPPGYNVGQPQVLLAFIWPLGEIGMTSITCRSTPGTELSGKDRRTTRRDRENFGSCYNMKIVLMYERAIQVER
jgi:hypothetical protein